MRAVTVKSPPSVPLALCLAFIIPACKSGPPDPKSGSPSTPGEAAGKAGQPGGAQPSGTTATPGAPPPAQLPQPSPCRSSVPGPRVLRRLTAQQFNATLKDLFRDPGVPQATFFSDPPVLGFRADASALVVQDLTAQQLMDFSEQVAAWVEGHQGSVTACTSSDASCRQQFIKGFGRRAFRAPLTDAQVAAYDALFTSQPSFTAGVHVVVQAMLQSPYFLYRLELGAPSAEDPSRFDLTPWEVATALSYLLTGSMPDDALASAADAGQLSTPAQIDQQVQRLLGDPRARDAAMDFMNGWLGLDRVLTVVKDSAVYSNLDDSLRQSMFAESRALILDTMFGKNGTFADILTASYSFVDQNLAQLYGVSAPGNGQPVTFTPDQRDPGILAHAAVLTGYATATGSSPVQRGKMVRTRLLCQTLPPPPGNLATMLAPPMGVETTRQRYEEHDANPACSGCHKMIDPVGFGFELYDGIGRRRSQDNGLPVDDSGTIIGAPGGDFSFKGVGALAQYLASNDDVRTCMVRYWAYYAFGMASWDQDACTQTAIETEAAQGGYKLQGVLAAIVHAPHFTSRVQDR